MTERTLPDLPPPTHGECPNCSEPLDGGGIWLHFYNEFITKGYWMDEDGSYADEGRVLSPEEAEVAADEVASSYGATRTKGRWGTAIGIIENDRRTKTACVKCGAIWDDSGKILDEKFDVDAYVERRARG